MSSLHGSSINEEDQAVGRAGNVELITALQANTANSLGLKRNVLEDDTTPLSQDEVSFLK